MNKKYNIILADPPWNYKDKCTSGKRGVGYKYKTLKKEGLMCLDVPKLADKNCTLFLWTTMPQIPVALEVMKAWGFEYKTVAFNWLKLTKKNKKILWGMGSYTRCLACDTKVYLMNKNNTVRIDKIENVQFDDKIWAPDGWKDILDIHKNKDTNVNRIKTQIGSVLCSDNHIWPYKDLIRKRCGSWRKGNEKRIVTDIYREGTFDDIVKSKSMNVSRKHGYAVNMIFSNNPIESIKTIKEVDGFRLSNNLGWIIGLFVAEGNYGVKNNQIRYSLHAKEQDFSDRIAKVIESLNMYGDRYFNCKVKSYNFVKDNKRSTYFTKKSVKDLFKKFIKGEGSHFKRLNIDLLLQTSIKFRKGFLEGILDGDGHYSNNGCTLVLCNKKLIEDIKILALSLGLQCNNFEDKPQYKGETLCYKHRLSIYSKNRKHIEFKGMSLPLLTIKNLNRHVDKIDTIDIAVKGGYFIANDIVTHNSNQELVLLGTKGKPKRKSCSVHSFVAAHVEQFFSKCSNMFYHKYKPKIKEHFNPIIQLPVFIDAVSEGHSIKPEIIHEKIVELLGDIPRIELFARKKKEGWDAIGNEINGRDIREVLMKK